MRRGKTVRAWGVPTWRDIGAEELWRDPAIVGIAPATGDDTFVVNELATGGKTVTVSDDGFGSDWLVLNGSYVEQSDLRLDWTRDDDGHATSAAGTYWSSETAASRLIVNGFIENVRASESEDFVQGNEAGNIVYGDTTIDGPGGADVLWTFDGEDLVYGGAGDDEISGGADDDVLYGNAGDDNISGGAGKDLVIGGAGADRMAGGSDAGDTVSYQDSIRKVVIDITAGSTTIGRGGYAEGDEIYGFTNVVGSAFNDRITDTVEGTIAFGYNDNRFEGGDGNDVLVLGGGDDKGFGGAGRDVLQGGLGRDLLSGGGAADRFVFEAIQDSGMGRKLRDSITDFDPQQGDLIDLSAIDADPGKNGNQAFRFLGEAAFDGKAGALRTSVLGEDLIVFADVDGDRKADISLVVENVAALPAESFLL